MSIDADLAFVAWDTVALNPQVLGTVYREKYDVEKKYPHFWAWHQRVSERPSVKAAYA